MSVNGTEPTIERSVKNHVSRSNKRSAPNRKMIRNVPDNFALNWVPCRELASVTAGSVIHPHIRSDVRSAGNVVRRKVFFVHAEMVVRDIEKTGSRRERGRLPVFCARRCRTKIPYHLAGDRTLFFYVLQQPALQIDATAGCDWRKWIRRQNLAGRAVHHVHVTIPVGMH